MSVLTKNLRKIINQCLFWGTALLIWAGVIAGTLYIRGYQHQSYQTLTDDEMIRITVQRAIQRMQSNPSKVISVPSEDGSTYELFEPAFVVPYRDVDHFLDENPGCCTVKKGIEKKSVSVYGRIIYRDKSGQIHYSEIKMVTRDFFK